MLAGEFASGYLAVQYALLHPSARFKPSFAAQGVRDGRFASTRRPSSRSRYGYVFVDQLKLEPNGPVLLRIDSGDEDGFDGDVTIEK